MQNCKQPNYPKSFNWDKVLKNGPSKICGRQPLKNFKGYGLPYPYGLPQRIGCLPQILLGPFLNTLSQLPALLFRRLLPSTRNDD